MSSVVLNTQSSDRDIGSVYITMENGYLDPRKRRLSKTPSKVETFENGCLSFQRGQVKTPKTKVFENADVMNSICSLPRRTKTYRFLIDIVDGRKRFENTSVDADICIRFRGIKNGGIRKRISVDVAIVSGNAAKVIVLCFCSGLCKCCTFTVAERIVLSV